MNKKEVGGVTHKAGFMTEIVIVPSKKVLDLRMIMEVGMLRFMHMMGAEVRSLMVLAVQEAALGIQEDLWEEEALDLMGTLVDQNWQGLYQRRKLMIQVEVCRSIE